MPLRVAVKASLKGNVSVKTFAHVRGAQGRGGTVVSWCCHLLGANNHVPACVCPCVADTGSGSTARRAGRVSGTGTECAQGSTGRAASMAKNGATCRQAWLASATPPPEPDGAIWEGGPAAIAESPVSGLWHQGLGTRQGERGLPTSRPAPAHHHLSHTGSGSTARAGRPMGFFQAGPVG